MSSSAAVSAADQPSTSRASSDRPLARRQRLEGGEEGQLDRLAGDERGIGLVVVGRDLVELDVGVRLEPRHLGERPPAGARRWERRSWSRQALVAMR